MNNKILIILLTATMLNRAGQDDATKEAIKQTADKVCWRWTRDRFLPIVGAFILLPCLSAAGCVATSHCTQPDQVVGAAVAGLFPSCFFMVRQAYLVERDWNLLDAFTSSNARLDTDRLPSAAAIAEMNSHHQLLRAARTYLNNGGKEVDKKSIDSFGVESGAPRQFLTHCADTLNQRGLRGYNSEPSPKEKRT